LGSVWTWLLVEMGWTGVGMEDEGRMDGVYIPGEAGVASVCG